MSLRTRRALIGAAVAYAAVVLAVDVAFWRDDSRRNAAFATGAWLGLALVVASIAVGYVIGRAWALLLASVIVPIHVVVAHADGGSPRDEAIRDAALDPLALFTSAAYLGAWIALGIFVRRRELRARLGAPG